MAHPLNDSSVIEDPSHSLAIRGIYPFPQDAPLHVRNQRKSVALGSRSNTDARAAQSRRAKSETSTVMLVPDAPSVGEMKRNINWPSLPNPLKRRNTKGSPEDREGDTFGLQSSPLVQSSPVSALVSSPQTYTNMSSSSSSDRGFAWPPATTTNVPVPTSPAASGNVEPGNSASPLTASPTSPQSFTSRQASRISSLLRRRPSSQSSNSHVTDPIGVAMPPSPILGNHPALPIMDVTSNPEEYNSPPQLHAAGVPEVSSPTTWTTGGHQQQIQGFHAGLDNSSPQVTPLSSSSTWPGPGRNMATMISPVSPPSAVGGSYQRNNTYGQTLPPRTSSLLASPLSPSYPEIHVDKKKGVDLDEVGFESPSDFTLFAEATSSLGFLPPNDFTSAQSPIPEFSASALPSFNSNPEAPRINYSQTLPLPYPSTTSTGAGRGFQGSFLSPLDIHSQPRSRSVPPQSYSVAHTRSSSTPAPPSPLRAPSRYSSVTPPLPPTRTQLIAEALQGLENDGEGAGSDDELPDYAQSQAEASERQRVEAMSRARQLEEGWLRGRADRIKRPWRAWERGSGA